jgi:hypothetical protein
MLDYLNNTQNRKEHPNENYARELMELFTMGIGNYTENDVKPAPGPSPAGRTTAKNSSSASASTTRGRRPSWATLVTSTAKT